jgi:elongation factor Ts
MAITAAMVKELRERTGAGMMECKKALVETNGDMDTAIEFLRKTGLAQADKKAGRVAAEGQIILATADDGKQAVLLEVNCETDFVAKDENFRSFAGRVAEIALTADTVDAEGLLTADYGDGSTVEETRQVLIAKLGENIQVRRFTRTDSSGELGAYIHGGRIGVVVTLQGGDSDLARDIAMHIAAINPAYISADDVPAEILEKEKEILVAQAADSGKPPEIIEKMVTGRLRKHLAEITLLGQPFVKDPDMSVEKLLTQNAASVTGFTRMVVGEGIEKRADNFAEEVMQQVQGG